MSTPPRPSCPTCGGVLRWLGTGRNERDEFTYDYVCDACGEFVHAVQKGF